jgi:hypothetical protein
MRTRANLRLDSVSGEFLRHSRRQRREACFKGHTITAS